jgi:5'-nucleotidase
MKRLIVDMDGVLADVYQQLLHLHQKETGIQLTKTELAGRPEYEVFPQGRRHVNSPGFFRQAPVMPGSIEALQALNKKYDLFIVSAAMEFPGSLIEKYNWLAEHFPFIHWQQIVFCGSKTVVDGDIMIDDHFKNLDGFKGQTILFTQAHNEGHDERGHKRVYNWGDILQLLG